MANPENPNLDDAQEDKDPGNEFEQGDGIDTGNQILDTDEPNVSALEAASRASESAFTLNFEDGIAPRADQQPGKKPDAQPGN
ncbi:hypothetical protein [Mucilaginibacter lappiensis]|uniref:Uncharacterized protein n=1 Tax=Mucilaginibacter lappiensis TaxID=354630 RepID=A0A1N6ZYH9_9SPHI|nr:hypothetical protein [Mucilaginibacter lappiensis]MBB6110368.1 hypothetical protein [Mucilaginibacter lappiensis]MBB6128526.1 hypothetical protein [Mucilaginibacter lappiensis]SIR31907.1 hypothetical protein SAMN05421821_106177 [Mucilaginibacter lappiensis]